jgi:hypothetical protein
MRYFSPVFELAIRVGAQVGPRDKIGGVPVGIDPGLWPTCAQCDRVMSHLGQFVHDPDRLDLGAAGRVLTFWQCENDPGDREVCETWVADSGANAAEVTDGDGSADLPVLPPGGLPLIHPEVRVVHWAERDDGVPPERVSDYYDDDVHLALDEEWFSPGGSETRLGGVPAWEQSASEAPGPPWTFVGQIASRQPMKSPPPNLNLDPGWTASDWYLDVPKFGDNGIAYLFLDRSSDPPAAGFFWQCG